MNLIEAINNNNQRRLDDENKKALKELREMIPELNRKMAEFRTMREKMIEEGTWKPMFQNLNEEDTGSVS